MSRRATRAVVCATLVALIAGSTSAAFGATPVDELIAPVPIDSPTGAYVVVLEEPAAASYGGGVSGLGSTTPGEGKTFDPHSSRVQKYVEYLEERQREVAAASGVEPLATYQVTLNGFSAKLAPDAAARVAAMDGVLAVYPERILRPDAVPPTDDPRLAPADQGQRGRAVDGADDGGAGVIVGIIDTGIAPENPSFAGARLRSTPSGQPYLEGNEVVFRKADGTEFRSTRVTGEEWTKRDYSTTVIGAQQFTAGATAGGFSFDHDVLSPRDSGGHGSLTAGIAAGRSGVDATVDGTAVSSLSGVAPGAKIAAYKACVAGADPLVTTDDSCAGSDVLSAIERAVADGVDVIGYSIGGASDASAWGPEDMALYNAAVAGVFIAASAGNAGPAASSVGLRGAPWYTTVAASTLAAHAATVRLSSGFDAIGVSISVSQDTPVTAPVVYAGDTPLAGSTDANLCYPGTIDPAAVKGRIVICDRGINSSTEKSEAVADAGGVGMILANVSPGSLDAEAHAVPTVHIDATDRSALREELANESGATATLVGANVTDIATAAPQVAAFSSRGPTLAAGGGILTPDVLAPGVAIAGATQSTSTGEPTWGIASGTSMAAAHVAGLAARYIGAHPTASSDEVKSAIMTTAHNAVRADGSADVDPFAQGAGHVDAARLLDPGLVYLSGPDEWAAYAESLAAGETGESGVGDLNLPSLAIDALTHEQTISRAVTATRPGTYRVAVSIAGVDVSVSPEVLTFAASGDTHQFEATFTNSTAPVGVWSTGYLTWASDDGTSVRSPLAVRPATADAPGMVTGDGITGTAEVEITAGVTGAIEVEVAGLAPVELLVDPASAATGHSGDAHSGDENGNVAWSLDIPDGSPLAQFTLAASDDSALDLAVYRRVGTTGTHYDRRWGSAPAAQPAQVTLTEPTGGSYLVVVNVDAASSATTWDLTSAIIRTGAAGSLTSVPSSLQTVAGGDVRSTLSWSGLRPETRYLGLVSYSDAGAPGAHPVRTLVQVDAGASPPVPGHLPTIAGETELGGRLTVQPGTWDADGLEFSFQWLRDGEPIRGAAAPEYRIRAADVGTALSARVTATQPENVNPGTAVSDPVTVKVESRLGVTIALDAARERHSVTVGVTTLRGAMATGSVDVWVDDTKYTGTLADGRVTFRLPVQAPGEHMVRVEYAGSIGIEGATAEDRFVVDG